MKLFISYAHNDQLICRDIFSKLRAHEAWYDERLFGSQRWWEKIQERVSWCEGFIYLLSSNSVQSTYCRKEFALALSHGNKYVFPVLISAETQNHPNFPPELREYHWIDFSGGLTADAVARLLDAIHIAELDRLSYGQSVLISLPQSVQASESVVTSKTPRILIADDHSVVRAGLRALLEGKGHFMVIAEAATGKDAVVQAQKHQPDVAILDIRMPDMSGIEACQRIVETVKGCRVIMLTSYGEDELLFAAIRAGASGYVLKRRDPSDLILAVDRASRGEGILDPAMTASVFAEIRKADEAQHSTAFADLTTQEIAVLAQVAEGLTNRQIANELHLGESKVRSYISSIFSKIGVANRADAAKYATKNNIHDLASSTLNRTEE